MKSMNQNSLMLRGSGIFKCNCCGRKTRYTGEQAMCSEMCPDCWELAGLYNEYQDGESENWTQWTKDAIKARCANIVAKGGELDGDAEELLEIANS
jgi:hypothetical protein